MKKVKARLEVRSSRFESKKFANLEPPTSNLLLRWYDRHRRTLPWRPLPGQKSDPYRIWLSEIMLQQTTVATVGPYFRKFVERWPTLDALAEASLDDILRLWAGLGYYRRARMLHQCAKILHSEHGGVFPSDEKALLALPGFGPYTAAAVAAIAFDKPANVVDGNVERVMARIFTIDDPLPKAKAVLRDVAATLAPKKRSGDYAQALMDLGATVCTPRSPKCMLCPWRDSCRGRALGIQETLPRRDAKTAKPVRRAVAFALFNKGGEILLRQRAPHGLLAGMMEIPTSPWLESPLPALADVVSFAPRKAEWRLLPGIVTHVFTHFKFEIQVAVAVIDKKRVRSVAGIWVDAAQPENQALPSVMLKVIRHALEDGTA